LSHAATFARCVKVAACDYEVARCDFVARQSRASKSRDKIAGVTSVLGVRTQYPCSRAVNTGSADRAPVCRRVVIDNDVIMIFYF